MTLYRVLMNKKQVIPLALFIMLLFGGGLTATVADSSLSGILTSWLDDKTEQSIAEIDSAIKEEQAIQTERLKEVLAEEIKEVEKEWETFIEAEKQKQLAALREYTDKHIAERIGVTEVDPEKQATVEKELERIFQEAVNEMENIMLEIEEVE